MAKKKEGNSKKNTQKKDSKKKNSKNSKDKSKEIKKEGEGKTVKESFYEIFEIIKKGKTKVVKKFGSINQPVINKDQAKKENKVLKIILIVLGSIILGTVLGYIYSVQASSFEYEGVEFNIEKEKGITWYHTSYPTRLNGKLINYNVWLRNDPRKTGKIPFEGDFSLRSVMVVNLTQDFKCGSDGIKAMGNFKLFMDYNGISMGYASSVENESLRKCDEQGRYSYVQIEEGQKNSIEKTGPSCYTINVEDCEILKATERFLLEGIIEINKQM